MQFLGTEPNIILEDITPHHRPPFYRLNVCQEPVRIHPVQLQLGGGQLHLEVLVVLDVGGDVHGDGPPADKHLCGLFCEYRRWLYVNSNMNPKGRQSKHVVWD